MTKAGNDYWRLHVELEALDPSDSTGRIAVRERRDSLWDVLPEKDREEIRDRLKVATGG